jgi:hypothetical protein
MSAARGEMTRNYCQIAVPPQTSRNRREPRQSVTYRFNDMLW